MNLKTTKHPFSPFVIANTFQCILSLRATIGSAAISIKSITQMIISSLMFFSFNSLAFAEEKIHVFPTGPVAVYTIYISLAVFWLAIIGLIVVIKMKLNEIERIQKLGIDKEDASAPLLE
jgi:hypothetical protein